MDFDKIKFAKMSDNDWTKLREKMKRDREELANKDSIAAPDVYNEMVNTVFKAI